MSTREESEVERRETRLAYEDHKHRFIASGGDGRRFDGLHLAAAAVRRAERTLDDLGRERGVVARPATEPEIRLMLVNLRRRLAWPGDGAVERVPQGAVAVRPADGHLILPRTKGVHMNAYPIQVTLIDSSHSPGGEVELGVLSADFPEGPPHRLSIYDVSWVSSDEGAQGNRVARSMVPAERRYRSTTPITSGFLRYLDHVLTYPYAARRLAVQPIV